MTDNQFIDAMKKHGYIIYICDTCDFRGFGASKTLHEMTHKDHSCFNEDRVMNERTIAIQITNGR